ncbi:MFS transporter, SP family, sugar:H+ symporter [Actinopolyspora lacussalsi subsp. righensis]|uniref:MFS transporter, SP family, sugar:H+ symporter n=1 Tax=Actinopolyspora righensis TaxID=995060 RepID=A0A1I6YP40_9ACTN|nr:sugar porter family MFS transporter [Actinopolyspora righensis]SFT52001.1 MFS transporter, SP family, sugar:H+ symporter [Actinopolyspora righensis]
MSFHSTTGTSGAGSHARPLRTAHFASVAALGGFLFGYDTAVINGAVTSIREAFGVGSVVTGLAVAMALIGSALGAWNAGTLADRYGRLVTMRTAAVLFLLSAIGSALPFTVWDFTFWRLVGGVAVGMASVIAPAYIAEIAPARRRGRLGTLQQLAIVLGIAISQVVNWAIAGAAGGAAEPLLGLDAWQWMLAVEAVPAVLYGALAFTIPESPRYLVTRGHFDRARQVLDTTEEGDVDERLTEIRDSVVNDHRPRVRDLRSARSGLLPIVWIGIVLSVLQQFGGINVIFYYSSALWQSVGIDESSSLLLSLSTQIFNVLGTVIALLLLDRVGRRPLLLTGSVGMTIMLGLATFAFSHANTVDGEPNLANPYGPMALVAAHVFVFFFAISWGPVVWVLLGEMFPNRFRAPALAVAAAAQWLANFLITATFPPLSDISLSMTYLGYTAFAAVSVWFVIKWIPETKGRTLEDMDRTTVSSRA